MAVETNIRYVTERENEDKIDCFKESFNSQNEEISEKFQTTRDRYKGVQKGGATVDL